MHRQKGRKLSLFSRHDPTKRISLGLSDSADYWPLTVVPSASRSKRLRPPWSTIGAILALVVALALAYEHGHSSVTNLPSRGEEWRPK